MATNASNSRSYSNLSSSFDASYLNRDVPRFNNPSAPSLRKSFSNLNNFETMRKFKERKLDKEAAFANITKGCGVLNSNKGLCASSSKNEFNVLETRTDPRNVNKDFGSRFLNNETDSPNSSMDFRKRGFRNFKYNYGF